MKFLKALCLVLLLLGCQSEDTPTLSSSVLSEVLENISFEVGAVIACASNDANDSNQVNIYFYPEIGSSDFKIYETVSADINPNEFSNYTRSDIQNTPLFNGFLSQFSKVENQEKWFIVTFQLEDEVKVSNPIRSKQFSKPSLFNLDITINQDTAQMPLFSWENNAVGDNAIYFQVVSDAQSTVLSATYTFESNFQYYNTSNVVLNVTQGDPPNLISGQNHQFTLMDVSEDNWVNALTLNKNFTVE